ncbi:hypothetical protein AA103193_1939 [Tanticharoenia sakaeratensis NBRC 103193]|nr:hypothetical protein AA103193_1939 [Tanticharoenia sakaeratensis NBRC 103193]
MYLLRYWHRLSRVFGTPVSRRLAKLTIFVTATIDPAGHGPTIPLRLAGDAKLHARHGLTTPLGYLIATFLAVGLALAPGHPGTRRCHGVGHRIVDLILNGSIGSPSACH